MPATQKSATNPLYPVPGSGDALSREIGKAASHHKASARRVRRIPRDQRPRLCTGRSDRQSRRGGRGVDAARLFVNFVTTVVEATDAEGENFYRSSRERGSQRR